MLTTIPDVPFLKGDGFKKHTTMSNKGVVVTDEQTVRWLKRRKKSLRRGKVLLARELSDIVENNGENGRRCWVYLSTDVYDITGT